jgi:CubicO group peptidase (beta-lactamase class C family)
VAYLAGLPNHREHGGRFEYRSILTDALGLVIARASGSPFAETLGRELWGPMGAETDAYVTVDGEGFAVADGGVCVTLRDLARFGRLVLDGGGGIVPAGWLDDTLAGAPDSAEAFAQDEHADEMPGGHYRNQWWVPAGGQVFLGLGIHGQFLYVDRGTGTVVAVLSTWETSLDDARRRATLDAFAETSRALARP